MKVDDCVRYSLMHVRNGRWLLCLSAYSDSFPVMITLFLTCAENLWVCTPCQLRLEQLTIERTGRIISECNVVIHRLSLNDSLEQLALCRA